MLGLRVINSTVMDMLVIFPSYELHQEVFREEWVKGDPNWKVDLWWNANICQVEVVHRRIKAAFW